MAEEWLALNRALWDERVPIHLASAFYDVEGFLAGGSTLPAFEVEEMGTVAGLTLLHTQCHFGLDTLSWARRGARVTGLDFSAPAVKAARDVAARAGLRHARFVKGDVYAAAEALDGERFDVVYTGLGALNWLPDIIRWAKTVAQLVEPGGRVYLVEFHPIENVLGEEDLTVSRPYFHDEPFVWDEPGTYADTTAPTRHNRSFEWLHGIGEVVSALLDAGLALTFLHEHAFTLHQRWPFLERDPDRRIYRMPADRPALPLMYSLLARA